MREVHVSDVDDRWSYVPVCGVDGGGGQGGGGDVGGAGDDDYWWWEARRSRGLFLGFVALTGSPVVEPNLEWGKVNDEVQS